MTAGCVDVGSACKIVLQMQSPRTYSLDTALRGI